LHFRIRITLGKRPLLFAGTPLAVSNGERCAKKHSDTPVDTELANGSEPLVCSAVARYSVTQRGGESPQNRACRRHAVGGFVGRKGKQLVALGRDKRLTAGYEGIFSKTLLSEK